MCAHTAEVQRWRETAEAAQAATNAAKTRARATPSGNGLERRGGGRAASTLSRARGAMRARCVQRMHCIALSRAHGLRCSASARFVLGARCVRRRAAHRATQGEVAAARAHGVSPLTHATSSRLLSRARPLSRSCSRLHKLALTFALTLAFMLALTHTQPRLCTCLSRLLATHATAFTAFTAFTAITALSVFTGTTGRGAGHAF